MEQPRPINVLLQISIYSDLIKAGAKPAAQVGCQREELLAILELCKHEGMETIVEENDGDRMSVWIFRAKYLRNVIQEFSRAETPKTVGIWVMGKLCGYSEAEIGNFIEAAEPAPAQPAVPRPDCEMWSSPESVIAFDDELNPDAASARAVGETAEQFYYSQTWPKGIFEFAEAYAQYRIEQDRKAQAEAERLLAEPKERT